jgi:hypothetical protein
MIVLHLSEAKQTGLENKQGTHTGLENKQGTHKHTQQGRTKEMQRMQRMQQMQRMQRTIAMHASMWLQKKIDPSLF